MYAYRFVGEVEQVFPHLHADTVTVDGSDQEGAVVLRPGDVVHTTDLQTHVWLQAADDDTVHATAAAHAEDTPETPAPARRTRRSASQE